VREQLRGSEWYFWWYAVHGVHAFGRDPAGAAEILAARDSDAPFLEALGVNLDLIRGRHVAVRKFLARPSIQDGPTWNLFEAFLLTSGTLASDEGRMTNVAGKLAALESEEMLRSRWLPPYEDETPRLAEFERDYFRALLLIRLGRLSEAAALREGMAAQDEFVGLGTVKQDAERMLRAELLLQDDDRPGALEVLRSVEYEVPHSLTARPIADQSRSRLLRGELEMELGDRETAKAFLVGLDESGSVTDSFFRPQVYRHLGRIAEDAGRTDEAIAYYTRLIHLWADCDPELVPIRQEIEARRNALVRATG
jgi:tetratricopeptide (TPR) repeat protein